MNLRTTTQQILEATAQKAYADARITALRGRLYEHMRRRWQEDGAAPAAKMKGLGAVRLDNTDSTPKPYVRDADAFNSWVAEHYSTEAVATIEISPERLEEALELLSFAGIQREAVTVTARPGFVNALLPELEVDVLPQDGAAPEVVAVDPKTGEMVPGIGATVAEPRLVVSLDKDRKAEITEQVELEIADQDLPTEDEAAVA